MRIVACLGMLFLFMHVPWVFLVPLVVAYVLYFDGLELLFAAFAIDVYFGSGAMWPLYTLVTGVIMLGVWWIRPRLIVFAT